MVNRGKNGQKSTVVTGMAKSQLRAESHASVAQPSTPGQVIQIAHGTKNTGTGCKNFSSSVATNQGV